MMTSAGTQDDDVSNDAGPDIGRKLDERKLDECPMKVGRELDGRKLDGRPMKVGGKSDIGRVELSRRCGDGRRRCYTAAPHNAVAMAGSVAARSVLPALLQQSAGRRNVAAMASNALDLATLLRWPTTR